MKVRQICMMVLLGLGVIPAMQAQTFDKLWKEVEQAEKKSLPKTVIKLTDEIYQKGEKERNSAQMLKAYMWRMKTQDILTPDSFYVGLRDLEQWAKQTEQPMDRAILHSLIAEFYANYAESGTTINTLRSREKKIANFFLFRDLNTVCPIYCRSIKIKAAKYCFNAITASFNKTLSELKMRISTSGIKIIILHVTAV